MRHTVLIPLSFVAVLPLAVLPLAVLPLAVACDMPRASAQIDAPAVVLNVDARRSDVEHALCHGAHDGSDGCQVLRALDASDGTMSTPPALPEFLPRNINVAGHGKGAQRRVDKWLESLEDMVPELRLPVGGVVDADLLTGARLLDARLGVSDDSLTFSLPALHIAVVFDGAEHDVALVEAHATDGAPIHFVEGGVALLLDAATHDDGEVVLRADALELDVGPDDTIVTPGGSVGLRVELVVSGDVPL